MYAAIRASERWRGIKVSEFDNVNCGQSAVRREIDKNFATRNAPARGGTRTANPTYLSSSDWN